MASRRRSEGQSDAISAATAAAATAAAAPPVRQSLYIAVVGAGAAGLVTARELLREGHEVTIYEAGSCVGGLWNYDELAEDLILPSEDGSVTPLPSHQRVHSSMYADMRTNLPREVMGYSDFPLLPEFMHDTSVDQRQYCRHEEVQAYLQAFAERYDLMSRIRFNTRVIHVGAWSSQSQARETSRASLAAFGDEPSSSLAAADALSWGNSSAGKAEAQAREVAAEMDASVATAAAEKATRLQAAWSAAVAADAVAAEHAEREASFSALLAAQQQAQIAAEAAAASEVAASKVAAPVVPKTAAAPAATFDDLDDMAPIELRPSTSTNGAAAEAPPPIAVAIPVRRSLSDARFSSSDATAPKPVSTAALLGWPRWAVTSQCSTSSSCCSEASFSAGPPTTAPSASPASASQSSVAADSLLSPILLATLPSVAERSGSESQMSFTDVQDATKHSPSLLQRQQQQQWEFHQGFPDRPVSSLQPRPSADLGPLRSNPPAVNPFLQAAGGVAAAAAAALTAGFSRAGLTHRHQGGEGLREGGAPVPSPARAASSVAPASLAVSGQALVSTTMGSSTSGPFAAASHTVSAVPAAAGSAAAHTAVAASAWSATLAKGLSGGSNSATSPALSRSLSTFSSPPGSQGASFSRRVSQHASVPGSMVQRTSPPGSQGSLTRRTSPPGSQGSLPGKRTSPPGTQSGPSYRRMQSSQDPNKSDSAASTTTFDAVVVAIGNYSCPNVPRIPGQHSFPKKQMHSHSYRRPEAYQGQVVLIVGASFSGEDIARDISAFATTVYVAARTWDVKDAEKRPQPWGLHGNIYSRGMLKRLTPSGGASFAWGRSVAQVDTVVYCTGYRYDYPFLQKGVINVEEGTAVSPLYRHIWPPPVAPTLAFVGLLWKSARFPQFEMQAKYIARVLSGVFHLPSQQEMEASAAADRQAVLDAGFPLRYLHNQMMAMPVNHEVYDDMLADAAGVEHLARWRFRMYEQVGKLAAALPDTYRDVDWDSPGFEELAALREQAYAEFSSLVDKQYQGQADHAAQNEWQKQLQQQEQQHNQRVTQQAHHQHRQAYQRVASAEMGGTPDTAAEQ